MLYARMIDGPRKGQSVPVKAATPIITFGGGDRYRKTGVAREVRRLIIDGYDCGGSFEYEYKYEASNA